MTDDPILDAPPALFTFFERMPRQGPGCGTVTADLYKRIHALLPPNPTAADMGCGSGAAGLVIAEQEGVSTVRYDAILESTVGFPIADVRIGFSSGSDRPRADVACRPIVT